MIDAAIGVQFEFAQAMNSFAAKNATTKQAERVFAGFIAPEIAEKRKTDKKVEFSTRSQNIVNRLTELFSNGAGNKGKDRSDIFNAVTDYYSHESSGGDSMEKQFVSSEFGTGAKRKQEFFEIMRNEDSFLKTEELGALLVN